MVAGASAHVGTSGRPPPVGFGPPSLSRASSSLFPFRAPSHVVLERLDFHEDAAGPGVVRVEFSYARRAVGRHGCGGGARGFGRSEPLEQGVTEPVEPFKKRRGGGAPPDGPRHVS